MCLLTSLNFSTTLLLAVLFFTSLFFIHFLGVLHSIVSLLKVHQDQSQLLERVCATLANIALYPPSIPYLLRQTISVADNEDEAWLSKQELLHLREEEETLLVEEIRLRERITSRERNIVRSVGDEGNIKDIMEMGGEDNGDGRSMTETDGDKMLLLEFDKRREDVLRRIQDLVFEEEFRQNSRRVELPRVLATLTGMYDKPSKMKSVRKQAQRLLINLR